MEKNNLDINNNVQLKEKNTPALLGFIFSFLGPLSLIGLILSIIGVANANKHEKQRKGLAIAGIVISSLMLITLFSNPDFTNSITEDDNSSTLVSTTNNSTEEENSSSRSTTKKNEEKIYNIGDTVKYKKFEITIENVSTRDIVGDEYFNSTPAEGGIYVCVDFKYKNITEKPIGMFSFPSIRLVDSKGTRYSTDISASSYYATEMDPDRKIVSDLNPGITVKDNDVYEISSESYNNGEWYLVIDNKVKYKIK